MGNKQPLVTIVLPTYNVEEYLSKCLDSIVSQTYKNIEIIVVIDGAKDGSLVIAQDYAAKDNRIKVITQPNSGSGPARNNGIKHANGELITFIDPDDWVEQDYIETLVKLQQEGDYDLTVVGYTKYSFADSDLKSKASHTFKSKNAFTTTETVRVHYNHLRFVDQLDNAPWGKLFKMSIIRDNNLRFPELWRSQDIYFNALYFNHVHSLVEYPYSGYCYRAIYGQLSKIHKDYYKTSEVLFRQYTSMMEEWGAPKECKELYSISLLNIISNYESLLLSGESLDEINKSDYVTMILNKSTASNHYHKIMRFLLRKRFFRVAKLLAKWKFSYKTK